MALYVKDWEKFQHFKDRNPIWIKLYRKLLDDKQWYDLDPPAAKLLVMLWLIAAEHQGKVPEIPELAFRVRMSESSVKSSLSKLSHWLRQDDIKLISSRYQDDILEKRREETESETETETETENTVCVMNEFDQFWNAYPRKVGKKAAQKAFQNARDRPRIDDLLLSISRQRASLQWAKEGGQFIPHPATWLNRGQWADVPPETKPSVFEEFLARGAEHEYELQ